MRSLTDIKFRIKSISDTRQITSAMETISIAKMRKAFMKIENNMRYFTRIRSLIRDIVVHSKEVSHRFMDKRQGNRAVYIVIASDKGLAGGYNHNILNKAWEAMQKKSERYIFTVGQIAREFFEMKHVSIDVEFTHTTHNPSAWDAQCIVDSIIDLYEQNMMDEVYIVYTYSENSSSVVPRLEQLLPLRTEEIIADLEDESHSKGEYYKELVYEPSPEQVLNDLVPQYLTGLIYGALIQSVASEHSSRMLAMSNATKNASEIMDKLSLQYNRARQEKVTNELTEILTAAMNVGK